MLVTGKLSNISYQRYLNLQSKLRNKRREIIVFLEHPFTITAGINYKKTNLLVSEDFLSQQKVDLVLVPRGGDFTAHEPGQLVIYPHIDLPKRKLTISSFSEIFLSSIQFSIYSTWNLETTVNPDSPGLYLKNNPNKKLVSIGLYCKSFFSSFGAALNIQNSLQTFRLINPCGGDSKNIVSIKSLGLNPNLEKNFIEIFIRQFLKIIV